jgi:hypothetical protein
MQALGCGSVSVGYFVERYREMARKGEATRAVL